MPLVAYCPVSFSKLIISSKTKHSASVIAPSLKRLPFVSRDSDGFWLVEACNSKFLFRGTHSRLASVCLCPYGFQRPLHLQLESQHTLAFKHLHLLEQDPDTLQMLGIELEPFLFTPQEHEIEGLPSSLPA